MSPNTSTIDQLAWEGVLNFPLTLMLGCVLAVLLLWSLLRELPLLGRWAIAFAVIRFVTLAVILWMLLGPTRQTRQEIQTPHTIALLVDDSGSMTTQDPEDPKQSLRWSASKATNKETSEGLRSVANLDRASVALEAAIHQWDDINGALQSGRKSTFVLRKCDEAETLSRRAANRIAACRQIDVQNGSRRIERIREELNHVHDVLLPACRKGIKRDATSGQAVDAVAAIREHLRKTLVRQHRLSADCLNGASAHAVAPVSETRRDLVASLLGRLEKDVVTNIEDKVRIKRYRFSESLTPVEATQWKRSNRDADVESQLTDLSKALEYVADSASSDSLAATVLFSDGGHNVTGSASPKRIAASVGGAPIHVVPVGGAKRIRDVVIQAVNAPSVVKHEDSILFTVTISGFECKDDKTELVFRRNGEEHERRAVKFDNDRQDIRQTFECAADSLGRHEFEFSVRPLDDEASEKNNAALVTVNVVTNQLKVLLAEGRPRWEYRYLEHLFSRDPGIEFDQLLFEPRIVSTGARRATARMPETVEEYSQYQVVMLGDLSPKQLPRTSQAALDEFVRERGGNVIVMAGRHYMPESFEGQPIVPLLPVQKGRTRSDLVTPLAVRLSEEGQQHEAMMITESRTENTQRWTEQFRSQPIYFVSDFCRPKPAAHTLIELLYSEASRFGGGTKATMALLSWHQVGAGKVVFLSSPATYHLRHRGGDRMHHRFWGQMLRWLLSNQIATDSDIVQMSTDDVRYQLGRPVRVGLRLSERTGKPIADAEINILALCDNKQVASIQLVPDERIPGRYAGEFGQLPAGAYRLIPQGAEIDRLLELNDATSDARFLTTNAKLLNVAALVNVVSDTNLEMTNTKCNRALLREIAEASGGLVVPPTAVDELLQISAVAPTVTQRFRTEPLWNRWRYLWLVFGCVFVEWFVRKSKGLL